MKGDGSLDRNYLAGPEGDKINAIMAAVGFNLRQLLKWFKQHAEHFAALFCALFLRAIEAVQSTRIADQRRWAA